MNVPIIPLVLANEPWRLGVNTSQESTVHSFQDTYLKCTSLEIICIILFETRDQFWGRYTQTVDYWLS